VVNIDQTKTTLWLVRHGQTNWNLEGRYQGQSDQPLNDTGLAQAHKLAEELDPDTFSAVFSSDLKRARQTAEVLANRLNLPIKLDPRLREIHQGEWEGVLFSELVSRYAEEMERRRSDPLSARPPGGESVAEVSARVWAAADDIASLYSGQTVIVVSHGLSIATLIARGRDIPLKQVYSLIPENTRPEVIVWSAPVAELDIQEDAD
jgi:alpha-ribazole phosphatase